MQKFPTPANPDRLIAIDYSGDKGPGQKKRIFAATWTRHPRGRVAGGHITLENGRTREALTTWLIALAAQTPAMAVSIDCCFSFPAWFLAEQACPTVFHLWQKVAAGAGEHWLTDTNADRDPRFWGKPHKRPEIFSGPNIPRGMRQTDVENKIFGPLADPARAALMLGITPKSPFQIGGAGSVGTGSLRAMPWLLKLWQHGFRVWPFETSALAETPPRPLLLEMYTRLLTGPVKKSNPAARAAYLQLRHQQDPLYKNLPRTVVQQAQLSEDAFDALVCCLEMLRHQSEFQSLTATQDPTLLLEGITWRPGL